MVKVFVSPEGDSAAEAQQVNAGKPMCYGEDEICRLRARGVCLGARRLW